MIEFQLIGLGLVIISIVLYVISDSTKNTMLYKVVFNWIGLMVTLTFTLCLCDLVTGYPVLLDGEVTARNLDFDWASFQRVLQEFLDRYEK